MDLSPAKRALLEKWLQGKSPDTTARIPAGPRNIPVPLSFPQQRQLFLELLEPGTAVNNLSILLEFTGKLDLTALEESANRIIERHDALRMRFCFGQGLPTPQISPGLKITIPMVDLQKSSDTDKLPEARRDAEKEASTPFDLTHAPLIRIKIYVLGPERHLLLIVVHHTIADGWSLGVFLRELMMCYQEITTSNPLPLPGLPIQYADFAHWQTHDSRVDGLDPSMRYWKDKLGGELPVLELPTDRKRGMRQTFAGGTHRFELSQELTEALEQLGRGESATLFMTLLTAFNVLLQRYSGQDDIIIGTPVANRSLPELEPLIGVFINTLALRTNLSGNPGFRALLRRVRDRSLEAYSHQDLPFEKLVEELKPKRDLSRTPVFQVVFNLQNSPMPKPDIPGLDIAALDIDSGTSQFDLTLMMAKSDGKCRGKVEYNRDLFTAATIDRMFRSFQMILEHAVAEPDCPISLLPLVNEDELHHLVHELNQTGFEYPREKQVHRLFEEQVNQTPDAVAVIHNNRSLTYRELNQRANSLAKRLQGLGVGPEVRVGIFMDPAMETVQALLGVLKAGGAYVPIHTALPAERVHFILEDADVRVLLTNGDASPIGEGHVHVVNLAMDDFSTDDGRPDIRSMVGPENLAYIIYTSGSTGTPKGVMVNHAALVNFLWSMRKQPGMSKGDVLLSVTSISFDIAALELFLPLIVGATVVVAGKELLANPFLMGQAIERYQVNTLQATPSVWQLLIESGWPGDPQMKALCGGEALTRKLADQILDRAGMLWNMYGPTETTIWSSMSRIQKGDAPITIGYAIGNTSLYILDRDLQPLPIGVAGELHIGGEGLARGYLNQPQLTAEKFIPDPFDPKPGALLYKTGDRARYLPDGSIDVIGRWDDQVKIHGHRIELGEIATVLTQHPSVQDAIVIARTETSGARRLVAYVVAKRERTVDATELQEFIKNKLPAHMTPAVFVELDSLPLSPNGKVDRKALPVPADARPFTGYIAPRHDVEILLAGIWQHVLDIEQVGIHDNFFDLGGASIQSLQIVAQANMAGLRINAEHIFEHQTIAELAAHIKLGVKEGI